MNHDHRTASSPLSQLALTKSPYLQLPRPVSLPYNYTPLPSGVDTIVRLPAQPFLIQAVNRLLSGLILCQIIRREHICVENRI